MQASNAPRKSSVPFANSGNKNTIPEASQIGVTPGLASFTDGFPPLTMTPLVAGGVPPYGADFNGILNFLSAAIRWAQAGASYSYDAAFSASIGGYPKGATLLNSAATGHWLNTVDNNTSNPDSGGANWIALPNSLPVASTSQAGIVALATNAATQTGTASNVAVTPASLSARTATEGRTGLVELATAAEVQAGTDSTRSVTPAGLQSKIATTAQAQALMDNAALLTPKRLDEAFMGTNQGFTVNTFWQKFPGGLLMQGGLIAAPSPDVDVVFPVSFIAAPLSVVATAAGNTATLVGVMVSNGTATGFTARVRNATSGVSGAVDWVAYGRWK